MSIDYPCICQQPSPWVRFQSFYNFTSLIRERLKSYPWGSEISLSCTPPVLDPIYLLFCIFKIQDNICFFLGNMNYNLSLLNDKEFCFFLIGLNSIFSTLPQSEYTSCEVYSGLPTDQPKSRCKKGENFPIQYFKNFLIINYYIFFLKVENFQKIPNDKIFKKFKKFQSFHSISKF
jgi:hypothetical protein